MEKHRRNTDGQSAGCSEKQQLEQDRMKEIWESIVDFFEDLGRARAAAELARLGKYDEARKLYEQDTEVHP
jgi:hypothetical protein